MRKNIYLLILLLSMFILIAFEVSDTLNLAAFEIGINCDEVNDKL